MTQIETILAEIERLMKWKPKAIPSGMRQRNVLNIRKGVLLTLKNFINSLPDEQSNEDLEEAADCYLDTISPVGFMEGDYDGTQILDAFKTGADWQKNRDKQILSTLYDDCSCLKDSLDKVTTGNLSHRIGNIKFSITGMQVFIKQATKDGK